MKFKNDTDFRRDRPKPFGAYKHITNEEYHAETAISRSDLELIQRSPAHYRYQKDNPKPRTEAMQIGEWVHTMVLEPDKFDQHFFPESEIIEGVMAEKPQTKSVRATNLYKERVAEIEDLGLVLLSEEMAEMLQGVQKAVLEKPLYQATVQEGVPELSCFAELEGQLCRARPDFVSFERNFIIDLKTTDNAHKGKFINSIYNFGYHRQAAFYMDVVSAATGVPISGYGIVAAEKEPPYGVCCYTLHPDFIAIGRAEYKENLKKLNEAIKTKKWDGYPDEFVEAVPKPWMYYRTEEDDG